MYNPVTNSCTGCHTNCSECYGPNPFECTVCDTGFFKHPDFDVCLPNCPSGFTENSITKTCDGTPDTIACFTFDRVQFDYTVGSYTLLGGGVAGSV